MSKFRVEYDVSFTNEDDAIAFINMVEKIKDKVYEGTGEQQITMPRTCRYHECFHDGTPVKPCGNYVTVDFGSNSKKHKNSKGKVVVYTALNVNTKEEAK